jgi:hypothetical protein
MAGRAEWLMAAVGWPARPVEALAHGKGLTLSNP